jgi:hypothetical protein
MFTIIVAPDGLWGVTEDVELQDWYEDEKFYRPWPDVRFDDDCDLGAA